MARDWLVKNHIEDFGKFIDAPTQREDHKCNKQYGVQLMHLFKNDIEVKNAARSSIS